MPMEQIDMTENLESAGIPASATQADDRFDGISIMLHWLTVLLIVIQFASIWAREAAGHHGSLGAALLSSHWTSGVLIWFVAVARLVWRYSCAHLPPFPPSMPKIQQSIAKANEYGLYVLLLAMPVTGLMRVFLRGQPFDWFFWHVPALLEPNPALRSIFVEAHEFGAKALMVLIGLHAGAALFHRLVLRDNVLQRMLPRIAARARLTPLLVKNDAE
jgi:cytochrome b561